MVVTIGIISLLVAMGMPAFMTYKENNSAKISAQDLKNALLQAQSMAMNSDLNVIKGDVADVRNDYYYVAVNMSSGNHNGEIVIGVGNFNPQNGNPMTAGNVSIAETRIDADARIDNISPANADNPASSIYTFYFIVPSGQMMFNLREPFPGIGYSPKCQIARTNCFWSAANARKSVINISPKSSNALEEAKQTIVIDGNGGDIKILDGVVTLPMANN
jgi:type II secretory pathway pseudopilin PulG